MKTIDAEHAKRLAREYLWGWRQEWVEDVWESPELRTQMNDKIIRWREQEDIWRLSEPEEVPCGWLLRVSPAPGQRIIGGYGDLLVNLWTGDVVELHSHAPGKVGLPSHANIASSPYIWEVFIRSYIEQLPDEQRAASLARIDKLPFTPVRFFPSVLQISHAQQTTRTPVFFTVEFDDAYLARHNVSIPPFKAMQFFDEKKRGRYYGIRELSRSNVLTITGQSQDDGKTSVTYSCTYPTTRKEIPARFTPLRRVLRIIPDLSEAERDSMPEDLYQALQYCVYPENALREILY